MKTSWTLCITPCHIYNVTLVKTLRDLPCLPWTLQDTFWNYISREDLPQGFYPWLSLVALSELISWSSTTSIQKTPFYSIFSNCEHWAFSWNMSTTSLLFAYLCLTKTKHRNPWNPCHLVVFFGPTGSTRWIPTGFDSLKIQHRSDAIRLALLVPWRPKWRYFEKSDVHRKAVFLLWGVSGWEFVNISWTFHIWTY